MGIIPVVNENDSVSYTEIESEERLFGDNDMLSAVVAILCRAKTLIILSDIDGFYDRDPRLYANAKLIERVKVIDENIQSAAGGVGSRRGTGGMYTKLKAAKLCTAHGIDTIQKPRLYLRYNKRAKCWNALLRKKGHISKTISKGCLKSIDFKQSFFASLFFCSKNYPTLIE